MFVDNYVEGITLNIKDDDLIQIQCLKILNNSKENLEEIFKQIKKKWLNTQKQLRNILKSPINKGFQ